MRNIWNETFLLHATAALSRLASLPQSLSRNDVQTTTQPGDIVLHSGNQLVIFFGSNSWSYLTAPDVVQKVTTVQMKKLLAGYKRAGK